MFNCVILCLANKYVLVQTHAGNICAFNILLSSVLIGEESNTVTGNFYPCTNDCYTSSTDR